MRRFIIFTIPLILSLCFLANCSKEKDIEKESYPVRPRSEKAQQALKRLQDIYNRYERSNSQVSGGDSSYGGNIIDQENYPEEKTRRKQIAAVEKCENAFHRCVEKCETEDCEEICLVDLNNCEKQVPIEVQTLKSY